MGGSEGNVRVGYEGPEGDSEHKAREVSGVCTGESSSLGVMGSWEYDKQ